MATQHKQLYEKIHQTLAYQIKSGLYKDNEKLPSIRILAEQYSVSKNTIITVLEKLVDDGLIHSRSRSGFFITEQHSESTAHFATIDIDDIDELWLMRRQLENFGDVLHVGDGYPSKEWFRDLPLNRLLQSALQEENEKLLRYGNKYGFLPLREKLAKTLGTLKMSLTPDNILLNNGVNDAIDLIIRFFVRSNTPVLVDSPVYYPLLKKLQLAHCKIIDIPRLADGPDCQVLEERLRQHPKAMFFTQSIAHNPTGTHISDEKLQRINALCAQYNCLLIENDIFSSYTQSKRRLCSGSDFSHHLYVGGFSKIISPSIRVGFIVGNHELINRLADFKAIIHINSSEYSERFIHRILASKSYPQHLRHFTKQLSTVCQKSRDHIEALGGEIFHYSDNSLYFWVRFPGLRFDKKTIRKGMEKKIIFAPGYFFSQSGGQFRDWTRINNHIAANPQFLQAMKNLLS